MTSRKVERPDYPEHEHKTRLLLGDPVAIKWDIVRDSWFWMERFADRLGYPMDEIIRVGLTRVLPRVFPESLMVNEGSGLRIPYEFWHHLKMLTSHDGELVGDNFLSTFEKPLKRKSYFRC